jgi:hypothetical protein
MKRITRKLSLTRDTIRVLAGPDLARVSGGAQPTSDTCPTRNPYVCTDLCDQNPWPPPPP